MTTNGTFCHITYTEEGNKETQSWDDFLERVAGLLSDNNKKPMVEGGGGFLIEKSSLRG